MRDNIKDEIMQLAELQFLDSEIAKIMELPEKELTAEYRDVIDLGRLRAEAEVRKAILKAAKGGEMSAQKVFMSLNRKAKMGASHDIFADLS